MAVIYNEFAVLKMVCAITPTGVSVYVETDIACILVLVWSNKEPLRKIFYKTVRGEKVWCDPTYSMWDTHRVWQNEKDETIAHTFTLEPWPLCEKRWFYFYGRTYGMTMVSRSPIFIYHRSSAGYGSPITTSFYPTIGHTGVAADGYVARITANLTWADIRNGPGTLANATDIVLCVIIDSASGTNLWTQLCRSHLHFNTLLLPSNCIIIEARVRFYLSQKADSLGCLPSLALVPSYDPDPASIVKEDYNYFSNFPVALPKTYAELTIDDHEFTIYPESLPIIKAGAVTKLAFREYKYDCCNTPPPWLALKSCLFYTYSVDYGAHHSPELKVTYLPKL